MTLIIDSGYTDGGYTPGKLKLSRIQQYPAVIGEAFGGGYFAGYISHTEDGNPTHALIVAPRATGYSTTATYSWKNALTTTAGTTSEFDGLANTAAMVTAGIADHPAAEFCVNLSIGGYGDWYLPARYEMDIAYFHLKPTSNVNSVSAGTNIYAVPQRNSNYTTGYPAQTYVTAFTTSNEGFVTQLHSTSTEAGASTNVTLNITDGTAGTTSAKTSARRVRAFRRIAL